MRVYLQMRESRKTHAKGSKGHDEVDIDESCIPNILPNFPKGKEARCQHLLHWMPRLAPMCKTDFAEY